MPLMREQLREGVRVSGLGDGIQITDHGTGFAVELGRGDVAIMNGRGARTDAFWGRLRELGLTAAVPGAAEARRRQRAAFAAANPPLIDRLRDRLDRISREVPFFRDRAAIYDAARVGDLDTFARLPFMRKRDLRANFPHGLVPDGLDVAAGVERGELAIVATSGSTDERLQVVTRAVIDRLPFGSDDLLGMAIGGKQPRTAFFTTPVCSAGQCHLGRNTYEDRLSKGSPDLTLVSAEDPFAIDRSLLDLFCEDVARFSPTILAADPIYLQCLVRQARRYGVDLPRIGLIQRGFEFGSEAAIRDIGCAFEVPILNDYGASEENRLAVECHRGGLHVRADVIHMEILDASGPCPPGVLGAVVLTTFDTLTPLVRYLIGDVAEWTGKACDCEFANWPTIRLHGRLKDRLRSRGRWITTLEIDAAIGAPNWLDFYRVTQVSTNRIEVEVIPALGEACDFGDLAERLEHYLDPTEIGFRKVARLDPLPSMKIGITRTRLSTPEVP
jgi:phenylacetate-CoA ligase